MDRFTVFRDRERHAVFMVLSRMRFWTPPKRHSGSDSNRNYSDLSCSVTPFERALSLFIAGSLIELGLWLFLYLRPSPFGAPFALDPSHYLFHALYYGLWAQLATALPFLVLARLLPGQAASTLGMQASATTLLLVWGALDREFQRFMGTHATLSWLRTYAAMDRTPAVIWETLARDRGGPWSSVAGLVAVCVGMLAALWLSRRIPHRWYTRRRALIGIFALLVVPTVLWNWVPGGKSRQGKIRPALLLVFNELTRPALEATEPARLARAIDVYQRHFAELEPASTWRFQDPTYPLRRHYVGPRSKPARQPNFIVLSLETFRAKDMRSMNPALDGPAPTPFLDALAGSAQSAAFRRYYASGIPTVHAFMSLHASLLMHPSRSLPSEATTDHVEGFPQVLRAHGYRALHFTGSDPDWDSQRVWLTRWYDEVHYWPEDRERDRETFRRASVRIREVAKEGVPFLAYLTSISNHTPFHNPEPALAVSDGATPRGALHNTMRYTDDVVRELYASLEHEPWFADTIWIVVGDHGFDLGDRGEAGGHDNLRHETTWVPLIVHGADPRLPRGVQSCVASHVDLAPTILELAGIWDDNSYMGHSLLRAASGSGDALVMRGQNLAYEAPSHSLYRSSDGRSYVYAGDDLLQEHELGNRPAQILSASEDLFSAYETLMRYVVDEDRIAPRPTAPLASGAGPSLSHAAP